jgi:alpha-L-fucosidase 2
MSGPSNSPEIGGLVMGPTMDHQIIRNLFANCIRLLKFWMLILSFVQRFKICAQELLQTRSGSMANCRNGWRTKIDPNEKHRHVSHLWGLHPGNEIHQRGTPQVYSRLCSRWLFRGDDGTGWSKAWKINFWARLLDGNHAYTMLSETTDAGTHAAQLV